MSQECKSFPKPKVRFSQDDTRKSLEEKIAVNANKPRITSVVNIDKPIKVVLLDSGSGIQNLIHADDATECLQSRKAATLSKTSQPSTTSHTIEADIQNPLLDVHNLGRGRSDVQETSKLYSVNVQDGEVNVPPLIFSKLQCKKPQKASVGASIKPPAVRKAIVSQNKNVSGATDAKCNGQRGKENKGPVKGKPQLSEQGQRVNSKAHVKEKVSNIVSRKASYYSTDNAKESNTLGSAKSNCKTPSSNSVTAVMPCHKYKKVVTKAKISSVKKTVMRDILGKDLKPYIGPGVIHEKQSDHKLPETVNIKPGRPVTSSDKLARPEYNSIMCTINKLNEVKKEKVIPDLEHLPNVYKDLINRKISTTLDFPFEETVFRNLIDLSIDEKQFSGRIMRSKDPEPRQRDVIPKLSDFFVPEPLEEYCMPVSVKPRVPEIQNNWNAFRIHEKLLQWKDSMGNEE